MPLLKQKKSFENILKPSERLPNFITITDDGNEFVRKTSSGFQMKSSLKDIVVVHQKISFFWETF